MQPRRSMSPGGPKSDLHQPKAKNHPQGQVKFYSLRVHFIFVLIFH